MDKEYKFTINTEPNSPYFIERIKIHESGAHVLLGEWTLGNCQNLTIGCFDQLASRVKPEQLCEKLLEIKNLSSHAAKPIAVLDLNKSVFKQVKDYLPIRYSFPYESSNGSSMVMVLMNFKISDLKMQIAIQQV